MSYRNSIMAWQQQHHCGDLEQTTVPAAVSSVCTTTT
jgi:hypothetical protein